MNSPELTLERLYADYPEFYGKDLIKRHINRYEWAGRHLKNTDIVLDVACGSGYGTDILAKRCNVIFGIDSNCEAVEYASRRYRRGNIKFLQVDLEKAIAISTEAFYDAIVCIETIEHFEEKKADRILRMFHHSIESNGRLILSTPNGEISDHTNIYHKKEYAYHEISNKIIKYFWIKEFKIEDRGIFIIAGKI